MSYKSTGVTTMIICKGRFHEDVYENGEIVELRKADMVGNICVGCHEEIQDNELEESNNKEWEKANTTDFD